MRTIHHLIFRAIGRYLQYLQNDHAVNIGPALDELDVLHARVVDGYDPDCDTHPNARACLEYELFLVKQERDYLRDQLDEVSSAYHLDL